MSLCRDGLLRPDEIAEEIVRFTGRVSLLESRAAACKAHILVLEAELERIHGQMSSASSDEESSSSPAPLGVKKHRLPITRDIGTQTG